MAGVSAAQRATDQEAIHQAMTDLAGRLAEISNGEIADFNALVASIATSSRVKNPDIAARWALFNGCAAELGTDVRFIRYTCGRYNDSQIERFLIKWTPPPIEETPSENN